MQLLRLRYPDRGFPPGRKESGPTSAPIGGYARPARFHGRLRMVRRNIPAQERRTPNLDRARGPVHGTALGADLPVRRIIQITRVGRWLSPGRAA